MSRRAAFIDRDGVLNEERAFVHRPQDFAFIPGAIEALRLLQEAAYRLVVITNQSGIARGLYGEADYLALTEHMRARLEACGVRLEARPPRAATVCRRGCAGLSSPSSPSDDDAAAAATAAGRCRPASPGLNSSQMPLTRSSWSTASDGWTPSPSQYRARSRSMSISDGSRSGW